MTLFRLIAVAFFACMLSAMPGHAQQRLTAIVGPTIIDGTTEPPIRDGAMLLRDGVIVNVGKRGTFDIPADAQQLDLTGKTIIPGLIDGHVHPGLIDGMEIAARNYNYARLQRDARHHLFFGTTHFVSLGFDKQEIFDLRRAQRQGQADGARVHMAGHGFAPIGGWRTPVSHEATNDEDWYNRPPAPPEARQLVDKEADRHVDLIKIWVDDLRGTFVKMKPELSGPIIAAAHERSLPVGAHIVFLEDARALVRHDVDFLAHSVRDKEVDDAFVRLALAKGLRYMPTLIQARYPIDYAEGVPAYLNDPQLRRIYSDEYLDALAKANQRRFATPALAAVKAQYEVAMANMARMQQAGVPIVAGGDTGVPGRFHGLSIHLEMELLVKGGLTPLQAIQAATLNVARLYRFNGRYGSLHEGKVADFVVLNGDPTRDITLTRSIETVWMDGARVNRDALTGQ
ncbi:MAG: amidohydrolase family protein [Xanthobacteraceae bacterium]